MKPLIVAGWILFGLEALFVLSLAVTRNVGDDAAGRGMATGFAIVLVPLLLVAGAFFLWGQRGGPAPAFWVGLLLLGAPLLWGATTLGTGMFDKFEGAMGRAQYGRFDDAMLTRVARAIDAEDIAELRNLLAQAPLDWNARDRRDHTILGHAVYRILEDWSGTSRVEPLRMLLAAGAPPAVNAMAPERTMRSVSEHDLIYHITGVGHAGAVLALDTLLGAGANPNVTDEDGRPIYFSTAAVLPVLEILLRHGADFTLLDPRTDRLKWNALMNAVSMKKWTEAVFFLQQGLSPDYIAPDGRSARTILAEVDPRGSTYHGDEDTAHAAFIAALKQAKPSA
ncbi:MAG: hypothetical protein ABI587_15135 [Gemmatimonadales bacterium]